MVLCYHFRLAMPTATFEQGCETASKCNTHCILSPPNLLQISTTPAWSWTNYPPRAITRYLTGNQSVKWGAKLNIWQFQIVLIQVGAEFEGKSWRQCNYALMNYISALMTVYLGNSSLMHQPLNVCSPWKKGWLEPFNHTVGEHLW